MRATAPAPTTATKYFSKNIPKGIGKSVSSHTATHATHPGGIGVYSCMSKTIIGSTLFIIIEDLISLFDLFKTVFGFFVVRDRKSTRLNSSHVSISYAVFCLKKKSNIYLMH